MEKKNFYTTRITGYLITWNLHSFNIIITSKMNNNNNNTVVDFIFRRKIALQVQFKQLFF